MKPEIQHALQILEQEPDNADALAALAQAAEGGGNGKSDEAAARAFAESRRVHRDRGDFELVVRLCDLELGWEKDPGRRADLLYEKGRVLADELLDEGEAEAAFQKVLKEREGDEGASEALGHIALVREAWKKIVKKYLDEAKGSTDRQLTTSLYLSIGEIYWKNQPGSKEVESYLRKALEVEPRNRKAAMHLERLLRAAKRWSELASLFEQRVEAAATKEERVQLLTQLAELQRERMKRPDLAVETMRKALAIDPAHPRAMGALVDAYTAEENWHGLLKVYESALKARPRGEAELGILLQLGMVWWKKLANLENAEAYFGRVRKNDPAHPLMLQFYRAFHGERNEAPKLLQVLGQAQKVERDPKRRLQLGIEMAEVAEASAGNAEKAIDIWKGVLKLTPGSPEALAALKRLYTRTEKWNALLELLKEQIDVLPKDTTEGIAERVQRLTEVVAIYRDKLSLDVMVINTYNTILALQPDHPGALSALAAKYEQMGRWNDLIGALQKQADAGVDGGERARLLRRIAQLWIEKFGNHNQAVKPLEELYALAPADPQAVAQLRDIYTRRRAWRALLDLERKDAERLQGADRRAKLVEMAKLSAERLGDAHEAIALWNRLLEDDPEDREALTALAALYEREKRWPALVEVLSRHRKQLPDPKAQVSVLERIGTIWAERAGAPERAVDAYQEILKLAPANAKAVRVLRELFAHAGDYARLEALYASNGQFEELCETLLAVAERSADAQVKLRLYGRVAEIAQKELQQPERAAKAYERILATDPARTDAARALVPIYRATEKWPRLLATYEVLLASATDDKERLALLGEIRKLCEEKLASKQLAFTWCARSYELTPSDGALERELERLAREADAWEELAVIYAGQLDKEPEGERKVARLKQLAELIQARLGRPEEAQRYWAEVLKRAPSDAQAQAALEHIYREAGSWKDLLSIYQNKLAALGSAGSQREARLDLGARIAQIEEEQAGDVAAAAATWRRVLEEDPSHARALKALERIAEARDDAPALADVLGRQLDLMRARGGDPRAEAEVAQRLGEIEEQKLGKPEPALVHYQRAFQLAPDGRGTVQALERYLVPASKARVEVARMLAPLYERMDDPRRLADTLQILLGAARPDEELPLLQRLAPLVGRRLGEAELAYDFTARIFERTPGDQQVRHDLAELAELLGRHEDHAKRLGEAEKGARDQALALDLGWELAQVYDERLHLPDEAERAWKRVLVIEPRHDGALRALERHYRAAERYPELRALLTECKQRSLDPNQKREILFQICDLDEGVLDDASAAAASYAEVLEIDPLSQRAFKALERIYSTRERWLELDDLYRRAVDTGSGPAERAQLAARRGELHLGRLDDARGACELFEQALAEDPRCDGARKGMERLMQRPELRLRAARVLEPLYAAEEAWPRLAATLLAQREKVEGREAVELLGRIAKLVEEKLGSRQQALATWREAMRIDPADAEVRQQVERLGEILERWQDLAQAWEEAEGLADPHDLALRAQLLRKAAELWDSHHGRLDDDDKARMVWRRLLDLDPTNLETARPAADALARLYEADEAWPELIGILRRHAEWAEPGEERKGVLRRIGLIQEDLVADTAAAVQTYGEILDSDGADRLALDALERLHAAREEWADLLEVLARRVDLSSDPAARRALRWRIAEIADQKLGGGQPSMDVVAAYAAVLDEAPEDGPALAALQRLYQALDRPSDLLEVLDRRLHLAKSGEERVELRGRIAQLYEGPLGRLEQALEAYREMLAEDPQAAAAIAGLERMLGDDELRLRAAEVLEPIYAARGDGEKLIKLHELWAEHSPDPRDRIARLRKIAQLRDATGAPESKRGAFEATARAARVAAGEPELPGLLDALERLAQAGGLRAELIGLYRELGPDILDAQAQERVYLTVAAESRALGDRVTAREYFRRVLDASPEHPRALDALESLYAEGKELEPLLEIYNRRAELALQQGDEERRRHYLEQAAHLCERELGRPSEAMSCYEQILEVFPADAAAATALEGLYHRSGRFADLADLLERRMGFADDIEEAVALRFRLGELYEKELADPDRAVENYRAAMGGDQDHPGSITALERFLDDPDRRVDAAEVLEPVYAARHDWKSLIKIYEIRLDAAQDPAQRLAITRRIARLYEEQLEDLDAAFRWFGKVFREAPGDRATRDQLARLAQILGRPDELAAVYEDYLHDTFEESEASIDVLRTLAQLYDGKLREVDKAKACYVRLLAHDPADAAAFAALESLLGRAERWHDLLTVYRDAADGAVDPARRKALLFKVCAIEEERLADPQAAIDGYRAVLELDPDDGRATAALDNLYTEGSKWHDLVDLLNRQLERASGEAGATRRAAIKLRLGGLYQGKLEDLPSAIDAYEEVLHTEPTNRDAAAALERLILDHDQRFRIAQILEPIYKLHDEWAKLVVIYDAELEFIDDKPRRVELLAEIARLHAERGGDKKLAFSALTRAWSEEAPEGEEREAPLYHKLVELAGQIGAWRELSRALEGAVESSYDHELQARVHARVAEIQEQRLGDGAAAVESWRRVTQAKEDDTAAWRALERLLGAQGRHLELVAVLEKRLEQSPDLAEQKQLAYRAAELYEQTLAQPDRAIATWRQALSLDEDDRAALQALARLYPLRGAHRELAAVLARQIELAASDAERRPLRFQVARLYEQEISDAFEAIASYKAVLEGDPADREALVALERLYEQEGLWPDLLEALDALAKVAPPAELAQARFRAAKVLEEKQGEPEAAIPRYKAILDDAPDHPGARAALEQLAKRDETRESAAAVLDPLYRARGEFQPLVELYELKLQAEGEPAIRKALLAGIAELYEAGLQDSAGAFAAWGRLLGEAPEEEETYRQLERLAEARPAWSELAALYEQRLDASFDAELQRELTLKLAGLYETQLGDEAKAVSRYQKARELPGDEMGPLEALDRLLTRAGSHQELAEVLADEAQAAGDPAAQAGLLFRLGELRRRELGDLDGAVAAYRDAIDREPRHAGARQALVALLTSDAHAEAALDILEPLAESEGDAPEQVRLAEVRLRFVAGKQERAGLLQRVAELRENQLRDLPGALDALARALAETPDDAPLADEVERIGAAASQVDRAAAALERAAGAGAAPETARELGLRAAKLYDQLGDDTRAEERYLAVLEQDPEGNAAGEALEALERIYRRRGGGANAQLAEVLEQRSGRELDLAAKRKMMGEVARLREGPLADPAGAAEAWRRVLDGDEGDLEALAALAALHESAGRHVELVAVLEQKARYVDSPAEQAALKRRVAQLYAGPVADLDRAVEAWRELADVSPDPAEIASALGELEALHARREDWGALEETLVRHLGAIEPGPAQVPILRRLAELAIDPKGSPEDAVGYLREIVAIDPKDRGVRGELEELLAKAEKWYDLVDALKAHAELAAAAGDRDGEVQLLVRAADVLVTRCDAASSATELLETILQRDPRNLRALAQLAKIYEAANDLERCKETLERAVALSPGGSDAAELYFRLGRLEEERLGSAGGEAAAEAFYQRAFEADVRHPGALEAIEKAARRREDWPRVAELLEVRAETASPADQRALWVDLARLYADKLRQPAEGVSFLERAVELAPDDPAVLEPLADQYFAAGRPDDALPLYRKLIERLSKGRRTKDLGRLHYRVGAIAESRGELDAALSEYKAAQQIDAAHAPTLAALGRLYAARADWEAARRVYRSMLLQNLDPSAGVSKADVYLALGEIHERVNEAPKAVGMYERGLELEPAHGRLREALARARGMR